MACHVLGPCRVLNAISAYPGFSHTVQVMSGADFLTHVMAGEGPPSTTNTFAVILRGSVGDAGALDTLRLTEPVTASPDSLVAVIRFERETTA